ncbi:MAG: DUF4404 family protein [Blastocatellia bacterium]
MDRQHLHKRLQQLHSELQQVELIDDSERQTLEQLRADIQDLLEKKEGDDVQRYKLLDKGLKESIEQFEASHPTVTRLMGETIDMLAKMGI